jgi:hypothetical protein
MIVASTKGSSATAYRVLPERTSVNHAPWELRRVIRFPLWITVPDHVPAFARLFVLVTTAPEVVEFHRHSESVDGMKRLTPHSTWWHKVPHR